jgi:uncharacterized protein YaaQ
MKLIIAIVQDLDCASVIEGLTSRGYRATKLASTGGFLREGNATLLVGVEDEQVDGAVAVIARLARSRERIVTPFASAGGSLEAYVPFPVEVVVGGATLFVLDVAQFEHF